MLEAYDHQGKKESRKKNDFESEGGEELGGIVLGTLGRGQGNPRILDRLMKKERGVSLGRSFLMSEISPVAARM